MQLKHSVVCNLKIYHINCTYVMSGKRVCTKKKNQRPKCNSTSDLLYKMRREIYGYMTIYYNNNTSAAISMIRIIVVA